MGGIGSNTDYPTQSFGGGGGSAGFTQPYKLGSGVMRGTQIIQNTDGSQLILGALPNSNDFGIAFLDPNGNVVMKLVGPTRTIYDVNNKVNVIVDGKLPDGTYGSATGKPGDDVIQAFS